MRAQLCLTRTGKRVLDLEMTAWDCDTGILAPDDLNITVPAYTPRAQVLDLEELLTPYKYSVALVDESVEGARYVAAAGPIVARPPEDDPDGRTSFRVKGRGPETLFPWRHVRKFPGWPLLDSSGKPNRTYDMVFSGLSYGTIMKRLVAESELFPGGDLPIDYEPDRSGSHSDLVEAHEGRQLLEVLDGLADLNDGVEYDFRPYLDENDDLRYEFLTGLDGERLLSRDRGMLWNAGGDRPDIRGYAPNDRLGSVATDAIFHGGKGGDRALFARASDSTLVDDGWPRMEVWDSSHSSVKNLETLQSWADGRVSGVFQRPAFEVRAGRAHGVRHGDLVRLASEGHWLLPDGVESRRVLSVTRKSSAPDWVGVQLV